MSDRMVKCSKFGEELPGLSAPPFAGEVGERIFQHVSQKAWDLWQKDMQIKVINEYRLNMGLEKDYNTLVEQMMAFLHLSDQKVVEVENADRGRGEKIS